MFETISHVLGHGKAFSADWELKACSSSGRIDTKKEDLRSDSIRRAPDAPVRRIDPDLQVDETRGQRRRHAVDDAAVALAVAAGDQRGTLGEFVLAAFAVEHELVQGRLHHRQSRGQFLQVD